MPEPGSSQGWNRYAYVSNNPLKYFDPSGHEPCDTGNWGDCVPKPDKRAESSDGILKGVEAGLLGSEIYASIATKYYKTVQEITSWYHQEGNVIRFFNQSKMMAAIKNADAAATAAKGLGTIGDILAIGIDGSDFINEYRNPSSPYPAAEGYILSQKMLKTAYTPLQVIQSMGPLGPSMLAVDAADLINQSFGGAEFSDTFANTGAFVFSPAEDKGMWMGALRNELRTGNSALSNATRFADATVNHVTGASYLLNKGETYNWTYK